MTYTDIGGGGALPPHGEDFFNRIVNVHWRKKKEEAGENIFVLGDYGAFNCFVGGVKVEPSAVGGITLTTTPLGTLGFGGEGDSWTTGSSSHTFTNIPGVDDRTIYVLCGQDRSDSRINRGVIMASTDGLSWAKVYTLDPKYSVDDPTTRASADMMGVVWDGGAFYAAGHQSTDYFAPAETGDPGVYLLVRQEESDILLSSNDGFSWGEAGRTETTTFLPGGGGSAPPRRGLLVPHCVDRGLRDVYDNPVPDGVYHYSLDPITHTEVFIRPDRAVATIGYDFGGLNFGSDTMASSVLIDVQKGGSKVISKVAMPGIPICGVGYSGGIIIAAGGDFAPDGRGNSMFAVSYDMGDTWVTKSYTGYPPVFTITGKN